MEQIHWSEFPSTAVFERKLALARRLTSLSWGETFSWQALSQALANNETLQELRIFYCETPSDTLASAGAVLCHLSKLNLLHLRWLDTDSINWFSKSCPSITSLTLLSTLSPSTKLDGLASLTNLETLSIALYDLEPGYLTRLLRLGDGHSLWPHLGSLEVSRVDDQDLEFVIHFLPRLRRLVLNNSFSEYALGNILASLTCIEHLQFYLLDELTNAAFARISDEACRTLHTVGMHGCLMLSSPAVDTVIESMENMHELVIQACPDVTLPEPFNRPKSLVLLSMDNVEHKAM